ncbi:MULTISPECIES: tetratricopeptide repeat protein [Asticcacaulis]|uniref:tetratricopeptide repeat protein n=1 Tax=Asticcacaulis TaxID=76890 RepID=UPI001AE1A122|nr:MULTISPECIES: tetratricopeptide repeat protein [Asticcacaulis]MBP2159403.1 Flp pilus assembly protein TadD [Asticcacaulis solisilvae]MDR6800448.1 Flp pilus assembly protein TadD [Asticcacaulis sp. BE141]
MRNRLLFCLTAAVIMAASPASAGLFGKKDKPGAPATNATPGVESDTFRKATKADIEKALRSDPLAQAAFFALQFSRDPTNAEIGLYLSNAQRAIGHNAEAADAAQKVLLFAPDNIQVLTAAGKSHIAAGNAFYAIAPLKHIIELKPNSWQAYSLLGIAYDQTQRPEDAQAAWATALKLSPDNPSVLTNIAMSKAEAGDLAGAETLLRTAAAQTGATMQVRQNLALVLGLSGNLTEAEKLLRQDLPPAQAEANLAWLQSQQAKPGAVPMTRSWDSLKASGS